MLCLFAFRLVAASVNRGARSVVGGGRLILNTAFPRTLLPLAAVITAFMLFLPTLVLYAVLHVVAGLPLGPHLLWAIPIFALLVVFASGATMIAAAVQVYFRDLTNFLPYFLRIWLYASPVLYYVHEVPDRFRLILDVNPLYPLLGSLSDVVNQGEAPSATLLAYGLAWAVGALVSAALMLAICVIQVAVWRRAMASWLGKRVQDLHGEKQLSWIAHLASYGVALVVLFTTMAGSAAAGWSSASAVLLGLTLLFVLAAQVLAGVQFLRSSGPPGSTAGCSTPGPSDPTSPPCGWTPRAPDHGSAGERVGLPRRACRTILVCFPNP